MNGNEKSLKQARCKTPNEICNICWKCQRNNDKKCSENTTSFTPKKDKNNLSWSCDGYVSENQGELF